MYFSSYNIFFKFGCTHSRLVYLELGSMYRVKFPFLLLLSFFCGSASAWWADEHRVVAIIADKHLSDQARIEVRRILGDVSLEEIANWGDSIKSQPRWQHSKSWHYLNLASDQNFASFEPIVGGDILWALNYFYGQLQAANTTIADRRIALQFFVHLVADIHQPLHVGLAKDRGGNRVTVRWFKSAKLQNLHKVWDGLLTANDLSPIEYARQLDSASKLQLQSWKDGSFEDWVGESRMILEQAYSFGVKNNGDKIIKLGDRYLRANRPTAEQRLLQAGIRLAEYLNRALRQADGAEKL